MSMLNKEQKLAILDWGVGGLGFYQLFKKNYPHSGVYYFSDTGAVPYGRLKKNNLKKRIRKVLSFLHQQGVTHVVLACNAASTVLEPGKDFFSPLVMTGVINPVLCSVGFAKGSKVGVMGGFQTVRSGIYRRALIKKGCDVKQRVGQKISWLIENGTVDGPNMEKEIYRTVFPLKSCHYLILACTHYPVVGRLIKKMYPYPSLIDPVTCLMDWVKKHWPIFDNNFPDIFITTGDSSKMRRAALSAFGVHLSWVKKIKL
ncbi:aspartate/glutamate racemase family protein [bacterium]|nr:aspartate/glutamate racemase family protein [bacterium]